MAMLGGFGVSVSDQRHAHLGLLMDQLKTARLHSASYSEEVQLEKLNEVRNFLKESGETGLKNREYFISNATGAILELFGLLDEIHRRKRERYVHGASDGEDTQEDEITLAVLEIFIELLTPLQEEEDGSSQKHTSSRRGSGASSNTISVPTHAQAAYRIVQRREHIQTLLELVANESTWDSLLSLQVLVQLVKLVPDMLVPHLQDCEAGFEALMQMLHGSEEIRNEALLLMVHLSNLSLHFRQFFMFQDGLSQVFSLIHEGSHSPTDVFLQDGLQVVCNVLRSIGVGDSNLIVQHDNFSSSSINPILLSNTNLPQKSFIEFEKYKDIMSLLQISDGDIEAKQEYGHEETTTESGGFGATLRMSSTDGETQKRSHHEQDHHGSIEPVDSGMLRSQKSLIIHYGLSVLESLLDHIPPLLHHLFWRANCNCGHVLKQSSPYKFSAGHTEEDVVWDWMDRLFAEKRNVVAHNQEGLAMAPGFVEHIADIAFGPYCSTIQRIRAVSIVSAMAYNNSRVEHSLMEIALSRRVNEHLAGELGRSYNFVELPQEGTFLNVFSASTIIALLASTGQNASLSESFDVDSVNVETLSSSSWEHIHGLRPQSQGETCANFLLEHLQSSEDACITFIGQTISSPRAMNIDNDAESPPILSPGRIVLDAFFSSCDALSSQLQANESFAFNETSRAHLGVFSFCCRVYESIFRTSRTACEEIGFRLSRAQRPTDTGNYCERLLDFIIKTLLTLLTNRGANADSVYVNLEKQQIEHSATSGMSLSDYMVWSLFRILSPWACISNEVVEQIAQEVMGVYMIDVGKHLEASLSRQAAVAFFCYQSLPVVKGT
eukprot:gb/GECG01003939.1/.p1 GENE.gb/GECG01003939.1/~~gb/GECG01003939.1/.p1  ORF type:complete len:835 (+),score=85.04 gb/GECG01003939.1/:1-2505(+)